MQKAVFKIPIPNKKLCYHEWQQKAMEVIKDLKVPPSMQKQFFKYFKTNRVKAEASFRYLQDHPKRTPYRYFLWLMTH